MNRRNGPLFHVRRDGGVHAELHHWHGVPDVAMGVPTDRVGPRDRHSGYYDLVFYDFGLFNCGKYGACGVFIIESCEE